MPHPFSVMTFNIRTSRADDGRHDWRHRKALAIRTVLDHDPDLLGLQEPAIEQWRDFEAALGPGWPAASHDRGDGQDKVHLQGGFARAARFEKAAEGVFWLSTTPAVPGSVSIPLHWGARYCVWMRLRDRLSGRDLVFAVTHFDTHPDSWVPAARILGEQLDRVAAGIPVVVVGDFNCAAGSPAWKHLTGEAGFRDAWTEAGLTDDGVVTFNAFTPKARIDFDNRPEAAHWLEETNGNAPQFAHYPAHAIAHRNLRIDWILVRGGLRSAAAGTDTRNEAGLMPSDHYPVIATLEWA
jgi:endonuclease/exonuclease/phosphatase family metal-dependent hydrolase